MKTSCCRLELASVKQARALATDMLKRVGLGQRLIHYPKVLSGGEQQRVALARLVVKLACAAGRRTHRQPDFMTGETVMKLMFELNQEPGNTLVLVTHDPAIAARCQRRITIEHGQIVES